MKIWNHRSRDKVRHRVAAVASVIAISLSLAACGSSSSSSPSTTAAPLTGLAALPPATILAQACAATIGARSMIANTAFALPAQVGGVSSMRWILTVGANQGTVLYTNRGVVHAVIEPVISYVNGNERYWSADASPPQPASAAHLSGKWLSIASSSPNNTIMTPLISLASLQQLLLNCVPPVQPTKGHGGTDGSTPYVTIVVNTGTTIQTFYVATVGTPHIFKATMIGGTSGNETTLLSGFSSQGTIRAPSTSVPIDPLLAS